MDWIFILLGALIAITIYLYFISKIHEAKDKLRDADIDVEDREKNKHSEVKLEEKQEGLKRRFCPLCNSQLKKNENLYAEMYEGEIRPKVIIRGCKYCYVPKKQEQDIK